MNNSGSQPHQWGNFEMFKYAGKKYSVTFVSNYDQYIMSGSGDHTEYRHSVICIVRQSLTGTPYCGVAILHPKDRNVSNAHTGQQIALKRALQAMESDVWSNSTSYLNKTGKDMHDLLFFDVVGDMYRKFRLTMFEKYHPDEYAKVQEKKAEVARQHEEKETAKRNRIAEEKRQQWERKNGWWRGRVVHEGMELGNGEKLFGSSDETKRESTTTNTQAEDQKIIEGFNRLNNIMSQVFGSENQDNLGG